MADSEDGFARDSAFDLRVSAASRRNVASQLTREIDPSVFSNTNYWVISCTYDYLFLFD